MLDMYFILEKQQNVLGHRGKRVFLTLCYFTDVFFSFAFKNLMKLLRYNRSKLENSIRFEFIFEG